MLAVGPYLHHRGIRRIDLLIVSHARGSDLDPSTREDGYSGKWGIDATAKPSLAAYTPRHRVPPEVLQRIDLKSFLP